MPSRGLIEAYFRENTLVRQHLESYNKFISTGLQEIIDRVGFIDPNVEGYQLKLGKVRVEKPTIVEADGSRRQILPSEARMRNLTYSAPIFLEIIPIFRGIERRGASEVFIGELPVMLKSKLCHLDNMTADELVEAGEDPFDPGGYFIINGSERVLVSIEDLAPNRIMFSKEKDGTVITSKVFSTGYGFRARCAVERKMDGTLSVVFPASPKDLGIISVLRALGLEKDQDVLAAFSSEVEVQNDILLNMELDQSKSGPGAMELIGEKAAPGQAKEYQRKRAEILLDTYLLPHIGTTKQSRMAKAYYLAKMAEKAIRVAYKKVAPDDKDHYMNKRIKLAGNLMEELFRYAFQFLVKDIAYQVERAMARGRRLVVQTIVRPDALTERIRYSMATGNWIAGQQGVSQMLDRTNYLSSISHLRRIISPLSRKHPHFKARDLHGTHYGKLCVGKDTNVLLYDRYNTRTMEELANCWKHSIISVFEQDANSLSASAISDYQALDAAKAGKRVVEIISESGRTIVATEDHPFLTAAGWRDAGALKPGDEVLVVPTIDATAGRLPAGSPVDRILEKHLSRESLEPLPVRWEKLMLLARLFGFTMADGWVGRTVKWDCESAEDADSLNADLARLGFETSKPRCRTYRITKGGTFLKLLLELGIPKGRRTDLDYGLPDWITRGPLPVKREFLAGFLGGCGPRPVFHASLGKKKGTFRMPPLVQHKREGNVESGVRLLKQISSLLAEFGVKSTVVTQGSPAYVRKDGARMFKLELRFGGSLRDLAGITQRIGYRYCSSKSSFSDLVGEYLRIVANAKTARHAPIHLDFEDWAARYRRGAAVLEKIVAIRQTSISDVRDFTTTSQAHTFVANGFVVHNCPNESPEGPSCALVKNMALLCELTTGEDERNVEQVLRKLGVTL